MFIRKIELTWSDSNDQAVWKMPLCEPIAIEEDNDVKWIREIDLDDLPIERSCTYF